MVFALSALDWNLTRGITVNVLINMMCKYYHLQGTYVSMHDGITIVFTICTRLDRNT